MIFKKLHLEKVQQEEMILLLLLSLEILKRNGENKLLRDFQMKKNAREPHHYFWLNPYKEMAFTRCVKCERKTKIRKICMAIDIMHKTLMFLNITCKYCTECDLIIGKQDHIEDLLVQLPMLMDKEINPDDYFIFGTVDKKDQRRSMEETIPSSEGIKLVYPFKDKLYFKIRPAGWYRE